MHWDIEEAPTSFKTLGYYDYENKKWLVDTDEAKTEFWSMGATLTDPKPKWNRPIKNYPTDFTNCIKPNGKHWDWDRITLEYRKKEPWVTKEQVKHHKRKCLRITMACPRYIPRSELNLKDYPRDFRPAVENNALNMDKVAELYAELGVTRDIAINHFRLILNVTAKKPIVETGEIWTIPGSILQLEGTLTTKPPKDVNNAEAYDAPQTKPDAVINYLAETYGKALAFWWAWENRRVQIQFE